jgi:hypothetical protein
MNAFSPCSKASDSIDNGFALMRERAEKSLSSSKAGTIHVGVMLVLAISL